MRSTWGNDNRRYEGGSWLPFNWNSIPVTRVLLFATVGTFLLFFFTGQAGGPVGKWIPFTPFAWYLRPWTLFTYAFLEQPSFWALFTIYILYSTGGMLERSWGSVNYAVLFFAFTGIGALAFLIPFYALGKTVVLAGLSIPVVALITAWAALDPELEASYWGVPVKAKFVAAVVVGMMYFQFGLAMNDPLLALFILAAPAAAWLYVRKMRRLNLSVPFRGGGGYPAPDLREAPRRRRRPETTERVPGLNPLKRRQEQEEMERLRRLLGDDDDDRPARRR